MTNISIDRWQNRVHTLCESKKKIFVLRAFPIEFQKWFVDWDVCVCVCVCCSKMSQLDRCRREHICSAKIMCKKWYIKTWCAFRHAQIISSFSFHGFVTLSHFVSSYIFIRISSGSNGSCCPIPSNMHVVIVHKYAPKYIYWMWIKCVWHRRDTIPSALSISISYHFRQIWQPSASSHIGSQFQSVTACIDHYRIYIFCVSD